MAKQKKLGICAFCKKERKLCDSHIQPRWLYRERGKNLKIISSTNPFERTKPKGPWEKLLCLDCEGKMSKYDEYSAEFFKGSRYWPRDEQTNWRVVYQYDYAKLKLFMICMMWRAAVAKVEEFFLDFELDEVTMEDLHRMIDRRDPGNEQDYSVVLMMREKRNGLEKMGWHPRITERADGLKWCRFDLNEFSCDIKIGREPTSFEPLALLKATPPVFVVTGPTLDKRILAMKNLVLDRQVQERQFKELHRNDEKEAQ